MRRSNDRRAERGFTLIELMVVITIIGLLVGIATVKVIDFIDEGRITAAKGDIEAMKTALDHYKRKKGRYPSTSDGLEAIAEFMDDEKIPIDPWGNPYIYKLEDSSHYLITSYGADGQEGGESDIDKDILSNNLRDDPSDQ